VNNINQPELIKVSSNALNKAAKYSLAFLWIFTGLTSVFFSPEIGFEILANANITGLFPELAIYDSGILDIILGL
jgi:hypothetical protein